MIKILKYKIQEVGYLFIQLLENRKIMFILFIKISYIYKFLPINTLNINTD